MCRWPQALSKMQAIPQWYEAGLDVPYLLQLPYNVPQKHFGPLYGVLDWDPQKHRTTCFLFAKRAMRSFGNTDNTTIEVPFVVICRKPAINSDFEIGLWIAS